LATNAAIIADLEKPSAADDEDEDDEVDAEALEGVGE
jgi:hypothetical protein